MTMRNTVAWRCAALAMALLCEGCLTTSRYAVAKTDWSGETGTYAEVDVAEKERLIPIALLQDSRTYAAARNCAQAHNAALDSVSSCTAGTWFFRVSAIGAATLAAVATGVAVSLTETERSAQRGWQWTALTSSVVAGSLGSIELFTNCAERRELQSRVAVRRAAALANAAHLMSCVGARSRAEWLAAVTAGGADKALVDAEAAKNKPLLETIAGLTSNADKTVAAAATRVLSQVLAADVVTCADPRSDADRKAAGERGETLRDYYRDQAHKALTECLNSEYLGFGEAPK